ncbi:MAG: sulfatase-like hydrolase/transferase [Planctomycetes bacterium]|nr:sulfatase-like hydrolase/transferase [Planctomycetota bacterium]
MPTQRPNILFILTDQQRYDTIAALGNPIIRTPSLDRIVREGTAFTSAYCPSPVCVPSRASLVHGQYPVHTGCNDNGTPFPTDGRPTFMSALTDAGYRTHAIGKLHFTPDRHAMFGLESREKQEELLKSPDEDDYVTYLRANGFDHITDPHGVRGEMYYVPQPAQMPARLHPTNWIGDRSVAFIGSPERRDRPWMLISSFIHPHPPFAPPAPWHKLYRVPNMPLPFVPDDVDPLLTFHNRNQNRYKYRDRGFDINLVRAMRAYYYGCISFIDYQVGRMLAAMEKAGTLDNTLILFTSDHGELLGDYRSFGKRSVLDAAACVPMLARLPGRFDGGKRCDAPVSLVDVMPTMLRAAGVDLPAGLDGEDMADVATGRSKRSGVFIQFQHAGLGLYAAVTPKWKYAYSAADGREYLFDRGIDRPDSRNLAGLPSWPDGAAEAKRLLIEHLRGDAEALDGDHWREHPRREVPVDPDAGLIFQDHKWADQRIPGYSA